MTQHIRAAHFRRDIDGLLAIHERQEPTLATLTALARSHAAHVEEIEAAQYQAAKALSLIDEAQREAGRTFAAELLRLVDRVPLDRVEADTDEWPAELMHRLSAETTLAGVVALLRQAEDEGSLRMFAPHAVQVLRRFAADEQRLHRAPSAASAFNALATWTAKLGTYGRAIDPDATRRQRQRALRERALAVADVIGLRGVVEQELRRATVPESTPTSGGGSGLVFGRYFEK